MASEFDVEVLVGDDRINAFIDEWEQFFERVGEPQQVFQSPALLRLWMRHYGEAGKEPVVIAGRIGGRLAAVLPLARQKRLGVTLLRFMGLPVAQFCDLVAEPNLPSALARQIWEAVKGLGADALEARRVRQSAALHSLLPRADFTFEPQQAPFADLTGRVAADGSPGDAYSAKYRSNFRRRQRRLSEQGKIGLIALPPSSEAVQFAIAAIEMKRMWLARHGLHSPAVQDERFMAFFSEAAADPHAGLRVVAVTLDNTPIAIDLSLSCKGTSFGHVLAVDPSREDQGVGSMLVHQAFAAAKASGNERFDLLAPANEHKLGNSDGVTEVASHAWALTPTGRLACMVVYGAARPAAKNLAARLPPPLVNWLARTF